MTRDQALSLVKEMLTNQNLVRHCLAVEAIMRSLARKMQVKHPKVDLREFNEEEWGLVGLLHDADYELTKSDLTKHTLVTEEKIRPFRVSERVINGIKAHHQELKETRETYPEKAILPADELSGLIVAAALVQPDKKLASVTVDSVLRKFKEKSFAAGVHRENILTCEKELDISLEEFVKISLEAMQKVADKLEL